MKGAGFVLCIGLSCAAEAHARPPPPSRPPLHPPSPPVRIERPAPPLPMLPSMARVRVEAARDRVVVVEEIDLPRGDWRSGGLDLYVAFGAPGTPVAIDARLVPVPPDLLESRLDSAALAPPRSGQNSDDAGDAMTVEPAVRRAPSTTLLLGRPQMAGAVIRVKEADLRRAYAASDVAALRIRSLLSPPRPDSRGARDVVVRLGIVGDVPLTLGRIQMVSLEGHQWITRAEANLCGAEAEGLPLAVSVVPKVEAAGDGAAAVPVPRIGPIAPAMAVRHASDDLCIRWWASD